MLIKKHKSTWVRVINPTQHEIEALQKEYKLHDTIAQELLDVSARAHVEAHPSYLYLVYHLPLYNNKEQISRRGEVDVILTKDTVITVEYQHLAPYDRIQEHMEQDKKYHNAVLGKNSAHLFYYLMEALLVHQLHELSHVHEKIEDIDKGLLHPQETILSAKILYAKRDLINYYVLVKSQTDIFHSLEQIGAAFFGNASSVYWSDLEGAFLKVLRLAQNYKEVLESFDATVSQLLRIQQLKYAKWLVYVGGIAVVGLVLILIHMFV
jgi:magnesium transporter